MPIILRDLRALEGPNVYYAQPCVKLELHADRDIRRLVADTIKSWAQATALVIGTLDQDIETVENGYVITTTFITPFPTVGELLCEGVVADLEAAERNDPEEEYSHDDQLFEVIRERKRQEPGLPLLQLHAEAHAHGFRIWPRSDGTLMIGTGSRGWSFDPAGLSLGLTVDVPWDRIGRIPTVAVTGTNGKTTTVRLISHIVASTGRRFGRTDTDGIYIGDELVEEGDWAGFDGARRVLTDPSVDVAVLETSRGGILRRGLGFDECDVSVITNISADHLGELGVETVAQMAQVKAVVAMVTKPEGYVVLNADDPLIWELRDHFAAPVIGFSRQAAPAVLKHRATGGATIISDDAMIEIVFKGVKDRLMLQEIPITVNGAATHNVENALAAIGATLALGIPVAEIASALRTFGTSARQNLGRLNIFRKGGVTAVLDYAHNEAGLAALFRFGIQLRDKAGGKLIATLGGPGDRPDEQIIGQGRLAGSFVDRLLLHEEAKYLRGRAPGEVPGLYRQGALAAGVDEQEISSFPDEYASLQAALRDATDGDVIVAAAHSQRAELLALLEGWSDD